jgi:hypothetical protein
MSTVQILSRATVAGWMLKVLQRKGMFAAHAELVVERLLEAEHRARSEYGVALLAEIVNAMDLGDIDPRARTLTVLDLPAVAILDGSTGAGQVGATEAMQLAIEKAQSAGIGFVVVKNSQPCGDVQLYAELAARAGCIGFCTTNSGKATLPAGDAPVFGTHPEAWAIPAGDTVLVAREVLSAEKPTIAGYAGIRGMISIALTAGLTGARTPWQKQKASPYGSGAEHCCLAIHAGALDASGTLPNLAAETWQRLGASVAGWDAVAASVLPDKIVLSPEGWTAVQEVAQSTRVPWTGE